MSDAKAISYDKYYAASDGTPSIGNASNRDGVTGATAVADGIGGVLTLAVGMATGDSKLFEGTPEFPSGDRQTFTYMDDAATTGDEREFDGMFNGVAGEYACTDTSCTVTTDKDGDVTTLSGVWTFTPAAKDLTKVMIPGVNHDADYLSFGYWVRATEKDDGTTYGVGTFFAGVPESDTLTRLTGTAKYSGKAAGMYGKKTLTPDGGVAALDTGHFTADANLTANFGGDTVAVAKQFSVTGSVSSFDDATSGIRVDNAWTVELGKGTVNQDTGAITGGTTTGQGTWNGQFFGAVTPDNDSTTDVDETVYPSGVAGEFNGHFPNGHVIGAFGATE